MCLTSHDVRLTTWCITTVFDDEMRFTARSLRIQRFATHVFPTVYRGICFITDTFARYLCVYPIEASFDVILDGLPNFAFYLDLFAYPFSIRWAFAYRDKSEYRRSVVNERVRYYYWTR